ncbi:hypothetical protein [Paraburkholderia bryophila]|jgi:hypothetical protein|uniref:Uncharacterized protein n=1 Tax=Paraburkholderia bryophila TaxID=420952 RepID=A0A329BIH7_9BURK|nr:hypothetical protein [Paraburkholderia bryophila]RAS21540.1 hypothetical protein BX591_12860 [Paraburkholderia bryophila]
MANTIDNFGNNMPYDFGDTSMPQQTGMQFNAKFSTVPMFPPDNDGGVDGAGGAGGAGRMRPPFAMPDQNFGASMLQGTGAGGGAGAAGAGGIMNILKSVLSTVMQLAPPLLGMVGALLGGAGAQGGQGNGTA